MNSEGAGGTAGRLAAALIVNAEIQDKEVSARWKNC